MHTATFTQHSGVFRGNLNRTAIGNRQDRLSAMLTECLERVVYITNGFHFLYLLDLFKANINLCKKLKIPIADTEKFILSKILVK